MHLRQKLTKKQTALSILSSLLVASIVIASTHFLAEPLEPPVEPIIVPAPVATTTVATTTEKEPEPVIKPVIKPVTPNNEIRRTAYLTAYTWWDNTPPGSSLIAFAKSYGYPTVHELAGGTGTYADPITIAVGHVRTGGVSIPDFLPGTRFYIPNVRAYFMVEDLCGDGDRPQDAPCHNIATADPGAEVWLDMWIEGASVSTEAADACARKLTGNHLVIENPLPHYAVVKGPIISGGACRQEFGDALVL
jgi:hypothetical protein